MVHCTDGRLDAGCSAPATRTSGGAESRTWVMERSAPPMDTPALCDTFSGSFMYASVSASRSHLCRRRRSAAASSSQQSTSATSCTCFVALARHSSGESTWNVDSCAWMGGASKASLPASSSSSSYSLPMDISSSLSSMANRICSCSEKAAQAGLRASSRSPRTLR